jgi:hypothetical protein
MATLTLAARPGLTAPTVPVVAALGGLALHESPWLGPPWIISHEATGLRVLSLSSRRDGLVALAALNAPGVDWCAVTPRAAAPDTYRAVLDRAISACLEEAR